jgi:hypothetical protein
MHIRRAVPYSHRCGRAARLRRNVWRRQDTNRAIGGYIKNAVHDLQHYGQRVRKVVEENRGRRTVVARAYMSGLKTGGLAPFDFSILRPIDPLSHHPPFLPFWP